MMKFVIFAFLFAACLVLQAQGDCTYDGETHPVGEFYHKCSKMTCHEDGSLTGLTCPAVLCSEILGYQEEDLSKPYPDCCGRPICK